MRAVSAGFEFKGQNEGMGLCAGTRRGDLRVLAEQSSGRWTARGSRLDVFPGDVGGAGRV